MLRRAAACRWTRTCSWSSAASAHTRCACRAATPRRTPTASPTEPAVAVTGVWPWLVMAGPRAHHRVQPPVGWAGLGAYHGLNPAMGWLFAVSLGMQDQDRKAVTRALLPIAVGHEASIAIVAALVIGLGLLTDTSVLHLGAAAALIAFGIFRFAK